MSTIGLRHDTVRPEDIFASFVGDELVLSAGDLVLRTTVVEFHDLVEAAWLAIYLAVEKSVRLAATLPKGTAA